MYNQRTIALVATLMVLPSFTEAAAQCELQEIVKLQARDATPDDQFGARVAIDGDFAIVGADTSDDFGLHTGSAYVFHRDGFGNWTQIRKLIASDAAADDHFGISVAISGDTAIVGARRDDDVAKDSGSAYIFRDDGTGNWIEIAKLTASDGETRDWFGETVAISGDTVIIGADGDDDAGSNSGSAYVFREDGSGNWIEMDKVTASDAETEDGFGGGAVVVTGDTAAVGAPFDSDHGEYSGSVYLFRDDGTGNWCEIDKITASDAAAGDRFGGRIAMSGNTAIISARSDDDHGAGSGSAYVFEDDGSGNWVEIDKLLASDGAEGDGFGWSVAIDGDTAVVGAMLDDVAGKSSGSAYRFRDDGIGDWIEVQKITASDGATWDRFGSSVGISGGTVIIGAHADDDWTGSAYIFDLNCNCPWDLDGSGDIGFSELLAVLSSWGPCPGCPEDFDDDDNVGFTDLLIVLSNWGPCP